MGRSVAMLEQQLANVQAAIAKAEVSQEYWPAASRRQRMANLKDLYDREQMLLDQLDAIGASGDGMTSLAENARLT